MKLLLFTQAVDERDSDLGFFVRWLDEFAKHCEHVTVICLREGAHSLPPNVSVQVLPRNKIGRALSCFRISLTASYDRVFVHMNPEYLVLLGWLWRLRGKQSALWYTHKAVNLKLRIAAFFADIIFTASKESFRLRTPKLKVMGHGIDTTFFSPDAGVVRNGSALSVGRLMKVKRHDLAIRAMAYAPRDLWIVGEGPELESLQTLATKIQVANRVHFLGGRTQSELRELYRRSGALVHTSETGSLDKVVLEALACGLPVITTSKSLGGIPVTIVEATPQALAAGLAAPVPADPAYVAREHSLQALIPRILSTYER